MSIEITSEQIEQAQKTLGAVNLDEVTIEIVDVKIREYKLVDVLDDNSEPVLGDDNQPLKYRKAVTRTAHIQNFVPLPVYNKMIGYQEKMKGIPLQERVFQEQIPLMTGLVLEVWQNTEEWMTLKRLNEGLDFEVIVQLFQLFFNTSRLQKNRVSRDGSTTSENAER